MTPLHPRLGFAIVVLAMTASAPAQTAASPAAPSPLASKSGGLPLQPQPGLSTDSSPADAPAIPVPSATPALQMLQSFKDSDIKFDVDHLMSLLRDRNHEGWVLSAYPDPKTGQPLIGAGVSLDLPAREHLQRDPLNPNQFVEPASVDLWQAAGLDPIRLNQILDDFHQKLTVWDMHEYRSHIPELSSQMTEQDANQLLRIAIVQSILNAKAYCRNFDRLTPWQQMAVSQLVFQMGTNLEEFSQFLDLINSDSIPAPSRKKASPSDVAYWTGVQKALIQSQWARLYRTRAISVIAMLDLRYNQNPRMAERRVGAVLRPAVIHRRHRRSSGATELASNRKGLGRHAGRKTGRVRSKRRV